MSAEDMIKVIRKILMDYYEVYTADEKSAEAGVLLAIDAVVGMEDAE